MGCIECDRFHVKYERLDRKYTSALDAIVDASAGANQEYIRRRAEYDQATLDLERVWLELENHRQVHYAKAS